MSNVDHGGNTLIVSDIQLGASSQGASGTSLNSTLSGVTSTDLAYQRYTLKGLNFNGTADTDMGTFTLTLPTGVTTYKIEKVIIWGANHTLVTATFSMYSQAAKAGVNICADQAITNTSGTADTALNMQDMTIASATTAFTDLTLYPHLGTQEGAAATANVTLVIRLLG